MSHRGTSRSDLLVGGVVSFVQLIDDELRCFMSKLDTPEWFREVLSYYLFPGGKRLRPSISLSLCKDLGGDLNLCVKAAIGLELIHASSLIHDDLPALDNDDYRRGRLSCHKKYGEANAILAGDALMMAAVKAISHAGLMPVHDAKLQLELAKAGFDICIGQVLDMLPDKGGAHQIDIVNRKKTAALFQAAFAFGAISSGVSDDKLEEFRELGLAFGRAFQLLNDYEDKIPSVSGRPVGSDAANNKITLLTITDPGSKDVITDTVVSVDAAIANVSKYLPEKGQLALLISPFIERLKGHAQIGLAA